MVGEGVLHECLHHPQVDEVLIINRRSLGMSHPKLKEIVHADFYDLRSIEQHLAGYNACFFLSRGFFDRNEGKRISSRYL